VSCHGSEGALMYAKRQAEMFILNDESGAAQVRILEL
jgi:hypothetical protein